VLGVGGVSVNGDNGVGEARSVGMRGDGSGVSGDRGHGTVTEDLVGTVVADSEDDSSVCANNELLRSLVIHQVTPVEIGIPVDMVVQQVASLAAVE
jgi:hypothetical protein